MTSLWSHLLCREQIEIAVAKRFLSDILDHPDKFRDRACTKRRQQEELMEQTDEFG
jgi:hypothetical protein